MRRQVVTLQFVATDEHDAVDLPEGAAIVSVDFQDVGGLGHQRRPAGVWIAVTLDRYDDRTGRSTYRDELPPPERGTP